MSHTQYSSHDIPMIMISSIVR